MKNQGVKLTYAAAGDYFIPNIALTEAASENIGKYGRMRKKYLQEHRPGCIIGLFCLKICKHTSWKSRMPPETGWKTFCRNWRKRWARRRN